jgi:hypothetical protein
LRKYIHVHVSVEMRVPGSEVTGLVCVNLVKPGRIVKNRNKIPCYCIRQNAQCCQVSFKHRNKHKLISHMYLGRMNMLLFYSTLPTQEEIENLPAFPREKLTLHLLLGSGAFGEVYEGMAVDILGVGSGETKVAVKVIWI